ncbi:hypothetical protein KY337_06045 [Candidatus Woesearchaeota archaeon]|nr:hypothetical protein [Candidatus Woesearchaeota archaeon]
MGFAHLYRARPKSAKIIPYPVTSYKDRKRERRYYEKQWRKDSKQNMTDAKRDLLERLRIKSLELSFKQSNLIRCLNPLVERAESQESEKRFVRESESRFIREDVSQARLKVDPRHFTDTEQARETLEHVVISVESVSYGRIEDRPVFIDTDLIERKEFLDAAQSSIDDYRAKFRRRLLLKIYSVFKDCIPAYATDRQKCDPVNPNYGFIRHMLVSGRLEERKVRQRLVAQLSKVFYSKAFNCWARESGEDQEELFNKLVNMIVKESEKPGFIETLDRKYNANIIGHFNFGSVKGIEDFLERAEPRFLDEYKLKIKEKTGKDVHFY